MSQSIAFVMTFISLIVFDVVATTIVLWKLAGLIKLQGGVKKLGSESVVALLIRSGRFSVSSRRNGFADL